MRWRDGALGALIATVAIEILKIGFSFYIGVSSFYQTVYGALAIIPIFLLWMYISWMAVLLGAVVAAALPNWRIDERVGTIPSGGVRLGFSLSLIDSPGPGAVSTLPAWRAKLDNEAAAPSS